MCEIAGIAFNDTAQQAARAMLSRMTAIMRHRGPDSEGFHCGLGVGILRIFISALPAPMQLWDDLFRKRFSCVTT